MAGYVKLFRSIEQWEWYTDVNTTKVFLHCLIKASRNDYRFKGIDLKKGQFPTSYEKLAKENGLSVSQVRTSIKKLILTGELTKVVTDEKTVITVVNWALYQSSEVNDDKDIDKEVDIAMTRESQGNDKGMTTTKNIRSKEVKELKNLPYIKEMEKVETDIFKNVEKEFGRPLSSTEIDKIAYWLNLVGEDYFTHAFREALMYRKLSVTYIDRILATWQQKEYTLDQLNNGVQNERK